MRRHRRFEELVAQFAGPLLDEPDLDRGAASAEALWPLPTSALSLGGAPAGREREPRVAGGAATPWEGKWIC